MINIERNKNKGQSVVEIIVALAIFFILVSGVLVLFFQTLDNTRQSIEISQAQNLAQEGLEATRGIANNNWDSLVDGSYDVESSSGYWQFTNPRSQLLLDKYYRQIEILPVSRNSMTCLLEAGDYDDLNIKKVALTVDWESGGKTRTIFYSTYLSTWANSAISCPPGSALFLNINVSNANIGEEKKSLFGVKISNRWSQPITIDKAALTWTVPGNITEIKIENQNYWSKTGPGTPHGAQPSGTVLDMNDFVLNPGQTYEITRFRFDSKIDGSVMTIKFIMRDTSWASEVTTLPFIP